MFLKVLIVAILFCYQAFCNNLVSEDSALLQQALKSLLKLKQLPAKSGPQNPNPNYGNLATPPQYMLDLYLQYKNGGKSNLKRRGNTVRSFLPTFGNINGEDMLLFNVSAIHSSEDILFAELHLFKRKMKSKRLQTANFEIQFYEIATNRIPKLGTLDTRPNSYGWQAYDITKVVTRSRQTGNEQHLIGMRIVAVKDNSRISVMSPRKFLRHAARPFLIVFSNDNETVNLDHLDGPLWTKEQSKTPVIESNGNEPSPSIPTINVSNVEIDEKIQRNPESVYQLKLETSVNDVIKEDINTTKDKAKRVSRSLLDNGLPEYPSYSNHIPQTSPGILRGRNKYRQRNDPNIIPYPDKLGRDGKRRKNRRNRKQRNRQLPSIWQQPQRHENDATLEIPDEEKINLCQQRSLIVDFAKIGWSEWIISPRTFEAHYCSGKCPFPLTKNMRPSNHATIQSIVHAIGLNTDVPPPCCVPDVLSSVTLLYYDEDRNVVLKNYPSMTVESCACR